VNLVEVNHIGLQPGQTAIARGQDVGSRQIALAAPNPGHAARGTRHLGRNHQLLAQPRARGQPVAHDDFGGVECLGSGWHGIHLGRVQKIDATFNGAVHDGECRRLVYLLTKGHGAQTDGCDMQIAAAEWDGFHGGASQNGRWYQKAH
jgi:hypothetical protein